MTHSPRTIVIVVAPNGQASVQTQGFTGSTCREASRFIEQALGTSVNETLTSEFHQTKTVEQQQSQRQ